MSTSAAANSDGSGVTTIIGNYEDAATPGPSYLPGEYAYAATTAPEPEWLQHQVGGEVGDEPTDDGGAMPPKDAMAVVRDVVIILLAGVAIVLALLFLTYLAVMVFEKLCTCCCPCLNPEEDDNVIVDDGPIARKAGLFGLTRAERMLILSNILQRTTAVFHHDDDENNAGEGGSAAGGGGGDGNPDDGSSDNSRTDVTLNYAADDVGDGLRYQNEDRLDGTLTTARDEVDGDGDEERKQQDDAEVAIEMMMMGELEMVDVPIGNGTTTTTKTTTASSNNVAGESTTGQEAADAGKDEQQQQEATSAAAASEEDDAVENAGFKNENDINIGHDDDDDDDARGGDGNATTASGSDAGDDDDDDVDHDRVCCICLAEYEDGCSTITPAGCSHLFHKDCLMEWLRKHDACPYCRKAVVSPSEFRSAATTVLGQARVSELVMWAPSGDAADGMGTYSGTFSLQDSGRQLEVTQEEQLEQQQRGEAYRAEGEEP